ncbi:MAG: sulfite exporter TauE/SafE family protein [Gemmatimonadetes bacterium]|uniref:Probable membrane transporter protein n=1 Tax=Candidatus Kutchimonas denitrificans TaxID=3056748 RepID=A0AAE4Z632_9BACT|nr:sulfite exporter TauE/SafE family protein [Gemmatimonadota bacterium]NIR74439.1 sulfite exporter TauE/SafE family protein [Candidatus Kutchimonas denitrificans]NIS00835.1 sulfite exporter TauE/SafE family protein [Gemmatimonadota bacterium]NIT66458.1 sulfite exporter TauE/SafE family protein [Gemmatimonadota bacterium]NIU52089.1 TSUP family transporter [Gemmatimonadota bacterium]
MLILGLTLGLVMGLALGMLGGGGSILTVPIFVYVLGFGAKQSIAMSLAVVGATALVGAAGHWRAGNVHVRVALVFGTVAMTGTYGGARLAVLFSGAGQLALFALVMIAAAYFMLRGSIPGLKAGPEGEHEGGPARVPVLLIVLEGLGVGVLTGLVGVGGGFLIVPALVLLARLPMKLAVGTSLAVIALKSAAGFVGYLGQVEIAWGFMAGFTGISMAGISLGTHLVRYVAQRSLRRAFALFVLIMGLAILYQNRQVILRREKAGATVSVSQLRTRGFFQILWYSRRPGNREGTIGV